MNKFKLLLRSVTIYQYLISNRDKSIEQSDSNILTIIGPTKKEKKQKNQYCDQKEYICNIVNHEKTGQQKPNKNKLDFCFPSQHFFSFIEV